MASLGEEEDDRDLAGSQDGSSDNDMDADDGGNDNEPDMDADADQDAESQSNASHASDSAPQPNPDVTMTDGPADTADPFSAFHPSVRQACLNASSYDIVPTTAAPHATSINAVSATADMRWVFSGGADGYVRKFNWVDSINSKLMLTVAQRHPFVDSVVKAGVLMTYWENMDGNRLSPVYSLASHSEGLWILSGLDSGAIRLQSVRHEEGKELAVMHSHKSAVSTLSLTSDEKSLLSGSWDKRVFDWDLNTGQMRRTFGSSAGQIATTQFRPESSLPVPQDLSAETPLPNGTYSSNYHANGGNSFSTTNTPNPQGDMNDANPQAGSPADSLFGGADSLFGDADGNGGDAGAGNAFGIDDDDEMSKAIANGVPQDADALGEPDEPMPDQQQNGIEQPPADTNNAAPASSAENQQPQPTEPSSHGPENGSSQPVANGLPHAEDLELPSQSQDLTQSSQTESSVTSDNTFLAASIDGTVRIWDRRQQDSVARIVARNSPPWCTSACWSPDGDNIYIGRRNGTVEEFSLHKDLRDPQRIFKLPNNSGPVTAVRAMPNGRHIICASHDTLRLYDLKHEKLARHSTAPFLIIPGHRTGTISQLYIDPACRYMVSTSGNRGWEGTTTEVLLGYEIGVPGASSSQQS